MCVILEVAKSQEVTLSFDDIDGWYPGGGERGSLLACHSFRSASKMQR